MHLLSLFWSNKPQTQCLPSFTFVTRNAYVSAVTPSFPSLLCSWGNTLMLFLIKMSCGAEEVGHDDWSHQCPLQGCKCPLPSYGSGNFLLLAHFPVLWSQERFTLGAELNTTLKICLVSAKLVHTVWPLLLVAGNVFLSGVSQALLIFLQSAALWFNFQMVTCSSTIYPLHRYQFLPRSFSHSRTPTGQTQCNIHFIQ